MKATAQTETIIHLFLNELEARILMGMVQNALIDDEPEDITSFRRDMFECLKQKGIKL